MQIQNILGNTIKSFRLNKRNKNRHWSFFKTTLNSKQSYELQLSDEDESLFFKKNNKQFYKRS